jgi:hypothetical protein
MRVALTVMKVALTVVGILVASLAVVFGIGQVSDVMLLRRIDRDLRSSLVTGDNPEKIERVLRNEKLEFAFDPYANRYQAIFRVESRFIPRGDVGVYVYVDQGKRLIRIEARNTYTFL